MKKSHSNPIVEANPAKSQNTKNYLIPSAKTKSKTSPT